MRDEVLEFINRRFKTDCNWTCQNCWFFSLILHNRFPESSVWYDVIDGHFVTLIDGKYYDWTGEIRPDGYLVEWEHFDKYDPLVKQRIIRDCIN